MDWHEIVLALDKHCASLDVPPPHWLESDESHIDGEFCQECAKKAVKEGRANFIDGGWSGQNDTCVHCQDCGRVLDYSLTDSGAIQELDHFRMYPPTAPLSPEQAFHIARLVDAAQDNSEVLALGERAVKLIS